MKSHRSIRISALTGSGWVSGYEVPLLSGCVENRRLSAALIHFLNPLWTRRAVVRCAYQIVQFSCFFFSPSSGYHSPSLDYVVRHLRMQLLCLSLYRTRNHPRIRISALVFARVVPCCNVTPRAKAEKQARLGKTGMAVSPGCAMLLLAQHSNPSENL